MFLDLPSYTAFHTILSLIAIVAGIVAVAGLFGRERQPVWNTLFLTSAALTSITGFGFPYLRLMPAHVIGVLSIIVLAVAALARYRFQLRGPWRRIYGVSAVTGLYFLVFVLIAQAFLKVAALNALAPTQSEPPFAVAQGITFVLFVALGIAVARRRPAGP
ncbi:hypothetical protein [Ferrovibrio sp.]|uniref:hypothetical protein n=1 Tax=Ferrovibrio sp. TaxID=1917215 RepID=UPI002631297E|nr:hypothetical protein [Ferrovibrio sp.]